MQAVWRRVGKLKRICQGFLWICDDFFMLRFSSPSCEILYLLKKGGVRETGGGGTNVAWRACPSLPKLSKKEIWFEGHAKIPTSASELIIAHRALEMIIHHVIRYVLLMSFPGLVGEKDRRESTILRRALQHPLSNLGLWRRIIHWFSMYRRSSMQ